MRLNRQNNKGSDEIQTLSKQTQVRCSERSENSRMVDNPNEKKKQESVKEQQIHCKKTFYK